MTMTKSIFLICILFFQCYGDAVKRPRGVPLSMVSLYSPDGSFTCFDGSLTIPFDRVNDDYCDCISDGSDEPGTSACPNSSFYCTNKGYKPEFIPSSRVNDGICDCCDGSDEYTLDVECQNNCYELGQAAREEEARKYEMFKEGSKLRDELSVKGKNMKKENEARISELHKEESEIESVKSEKEATKFEIEEREKAALDVYRQQEEEIRKQKEEEDKLKNEKEALEKFNEFDSNRDGFINNAEVIAFALFDQNKDGEVTEDEVKLVLNNEEKMSFEGFLTTGWPYVKQLFALKEIKSTQEFNNENDLNEEDAEQHAHELSSDLSNEDGDEENSTDETPDSEDNEGEDDQDSNFSETPKTEYDEETQKLIQEANAARHEFDEAVRNLRDVQREIKQIEEALTKDYGKEDEFAYLVGECFEYTDREYIYKLCPFDQVSQRSKDGGIETSLGSWGSWQSDKYDVMLYDRGQSCWNGPQRSTKVILSCNSRTEVVSASEPNRCEYQLEFHTPALCIWNESQKKSDDEHDEL